MNKVTAFFLAPFSFLYGIGVSFYQSLFQSGLLKSIKFNIPVISIGNLSVGGTGKSPHIEYLIRLLDAYMPVGVLSRGYKRKTVGHILLNLSHTVEDVGDEPVQIKRKFPHVPFAVNKNRSTGIPKLLSQHPEIKVILLDDAFQHLEVTPSLSILLTEFAHPYSEDYLLPGGRLREWRYGARRADIVIVTKCPHSPTPDEEFIWRKKLRLQERQQLFFTGIKYLQPYNIFNREQVYFLNPSLHIFLISAIAQSDYLTDFIRPQVGALTEFIYEDHHYFDEVELNVIIQKYLAISHSNKMILTTEKDATRLMLHSSLFEKHQIVIYAMPIEIECFDKIRFDSWIKNNLLAFKV